MKEILSPAGNPEKLRAAILYGANAVYLAGQTFGMRAAADNFSPDELRDAVAYAHARNVRVYVTVNTMPRTAEYPRLAAYLDELADAGADAVIVSDMGVLSLVRERHPELEIHISTQASAVSAASCRAYAALGARRVVLARELTLDEIAAIRRETPPELELEAFIHGSMCISYSGRCLLSNHFTGRDANRGMCAQPCRWNFNEVRVAEEKRPDDVLTLEQYPEGTFVMSSKDMCMIEHIPELMASGIDSFKIEGRMKSAYYAAVTTNAYRIAIDRYERDPENYRFDPALLRELESVSHREYATGFYFDDPAKEAQVVSQGGYLREKAYLATALSYDASTGEALFIQRNKLTRGETVELITPGAVGKPFTAADLFDENGAPIESAPHPGMHFRLAVPFPVSPGDILRS